VGNPRDNYLAARDALMALHTIAGESTEARLLADALYGFIDTNDYGAMMVATRQAETLLGRRDE
jgi:hypothetical protein